MSVHDFQRKINASNVHQITDSIRANGFWSTHPIVWFRHYGKPMIIFGHHRREGAVAAKSGGYAVEMTGVTLLETANLIRAENWGTWKVRETVELEARLGNPHYMKLMEYVTAGIAVSAAASMLCGETAGSSNQRKKVKDGSFKVKTTTHADAVITLLKKFPGDEIIRKQNFIKALSRCLFVPRFDINTFIKRAALNPGLVVNRSTVVDFTEVIESVYNHASKTPIPVKFLADQMARERAAVICPVKRKEAA